MDIRPIRTEEDHAAALRRIEALWGAAPDTPEGDELDVLATLVERYEETRWPVQAASPVDFLKFMMRQNGRTQRDLAALLDSRSRASEILTGKRDLTLGQIRLLARHWRIPAAALIGELEDA
jgi:HTH-type transcriptional regulator/antitoxin HigA